MKKFQFRYQTLLEVRDRRKKAEEEKFQRLMGELQSSEAELARLKQEEGVQREAWVAMQLEGPLDLQQMLLYQEYFQRMELRQKAQERSIEDARARVLNQREVLALAMRELEAIAKLKERDEKAWLEAVERAEAQVIDELATMRHARKGEPGS